MSHITAPRVITLGTAGGPRWWPYRDTRPRAGIATAVVVGDSFYLVDCGYGTGGQLVRAGLSMQNLRAMFLTHLHSDHTADLANLAIFGLYELSDRLTDPVRLIGPGNRGMLPPASPRAVTPPKPIAPNSPTPGTREMFELLIAANATDLNDRIVDSLRPSPLDLIEAQDIDIPSSVGFHANDNPTPAMEPFTIYEDDAVRVVASLVEHPPMAPAFGFRFESEGGSVTISGDTTCTPNMITLALGTDLLLHEAIDFGWVDERYQHEDDDISRASRDHHYKSHTGVSDAAKVAEQAEVRKLALHHLVPGHADDSVWLEGEKYFDRAFILPNDLDSISLSD